MGDSFCWDWLLMAGRQMATGGAANESWRGCKWKPAGRHLEAGGAANGSPWGDKCKPVGRQMEAGGAAHGGSHE